MLEKFKVIPVVVLHNEQEAKEQLSALCRGNLPVAEITFRTDYAEEGIKYAVKNFPELYVGAGTVIYAEQCKKAIDAGAKFIVSPGFSPEVCLLCNEYKVNYLPGCVTPTEIIHALSYGISTVKFFPANVYGGLSAIKALSAPFPQIKFLPTGGVNESNLAEFLAFDKIAAVGGSWMMKGDIVANCNRINEIIGRMKNEKHT